MQRIEFLVLSEINTVNTFRFPGTPKFLKARYSPVSSFIQTWWLIRPGSVEIDVDIYALRDNQILPENVDLDYLDTVFRKVNSEYYLESDAIHLFKKIVSFEDMKIVNGTFVPKSSG